MLPMEATYNQRGERDTINHNFEKEEKTIRILLMGDSVTFGWPSKKGYVDYFRENLQNQNPDFKIETINCSVIANNILEIYKLYQKRCSQYQDVDFIIAQTTLDTLPLNFVLFYGENNGSDFGLLKAVLDNYKTKSLDFESNIAKRISLDEFNLPIFHPNKFEIEEIEKYYSPKLWGYYKSNLIRFIENHSILINSHVKNQSFTENYLKKHSLLVEGPKNPKKKTALKVIEKWREELKTKETEFIVLNVPNARGIQLGSKQKTEFSDSIYQEYQNFIAELNQKNIHQIDFLKILQKYNQNDIYYIDEDIHPNQKGYKIIGKTLADYFGENFNLKGTK